MRRAALLGLSLGLAALGAAVGLADHPPAIDLARGSEGFDAHPGLVLLDYDRDTRQALVMVDFARMPADTAVLTLALDYGDEPRDWSLNVGDSRSNNGFAGDGAHQSRDSELQVKGTTLAVYGDDHGPQDKDRRLHVEPEVVAQGSRLLVEISNQRARWSPGPGALDEHASPYVFALAGQDDREGEPNRVVYVGLNRVVSGTYRSGRGVTRAEFHFRPLEEVWDAPEEGEAQPSGWMH